jgi:transcription elongation GreA/GreB family factor
MATFSKKMMGKEVGDAATYAAPHKMDGKALVMSENPGKDSSISSLNTMKMSVGVINNGQSETKTTGIVTRGNGAATKGITARGTMA